MRLSPRGEGLFSPLASSAPHPRRHLLFLFVIPAAGVPGERTCSLGWEGNLLLVSA
jgi:hypothetical protein